MTLSPVDTISYANKIKKDNDNNEIATKNDIEKLKQATHNDIKILKMELQAFIVRSFIVSIGMIGGLQAFFHFLKI